jgi:hypothetical protein
MSNHQSQTRPHHRMRSHRTLLVVAGTFAALTVLVPTVSASQEQHGRTFHLVKVCDPGGCTVTESNYPQISEETRITYEGTTPDALVATVHAKHGTAVGNCDISAVFAGTGPGTCVFQGGTGSLTPFRITLAVNLDGADWSWDGEFHPRP